MECEELQCSGEAGTKIRILSIGFYFLVAAFWEYRCWGQDIGYPQGEKDSASKYNLSTSKATNIFP